MSNHLTIDQLAGLAPSQSVYELLNGQQWIVESTGHNNFTQFAKLRKKNNPEWGTFTVNKLTASRFSLTPPTAEEIKTNQEAYAKKRNIKPGDSNYFACTCSPEGKDECESLLNTVKESLNASDSNLLTQVVASLHMDYSARITEIACDQWFGVYSKTFDLDANNSYKEVNPPVFSTEIECDHVEHGIAATWYAYYQKFGKRRVNKK